MIRILCGAEADLYTYSAQLLRRSDRVVWLAADTPTCRSWDGIRRLLAQLATRDADRYHAILDRHRVAASLVLFGLDADLRPADRAAQLDLGARIDSHMSHNWMIQRPLHEAWAEILMELLEETGLTLLVSDLMRLDLESSYTLKALFRLFPSRAPDLILCHDPQPPRPPVSETGFIWYTPDNVIDKEILDFRTLGAQIEDIPEHDDPIDEDGRRALLLELDSGDDHDLETRARQALATAPADPATHSLAVEAMRKAFACYGHVGVLRLGLDLFASQPKLAPELAADAHAIFAQAIHNRYFQSGPESPLTALIETHLRAALEHEVRPRRKRALIYRMAVTLGRRKKEFAEANRWAERAVEDSEHESSPFWAAYHEAWGRNIRAYLRMRLGDMEGACDDSMTAFEILDRAGERWTDEAPSLPAEERPTKVDLPASQAVISSNVTILGKVLKNPEQIERWQGNLRRVATHLAGMDRFEADGWIVLHRSQHRADLALPKALQGLEGAQQENDSVFAFQYTLHVGDLSYRLGDLKRACEYLEEARDLRSTLGDPEHYADLRLPLASALSRIGRDTEAESLAREVLAMAHALHERAELLAFQGLLAAKSDAVLAEELLNAAIDLAVESGDQGLLLRVATAAGDASARLGKAQEARAAYTQAVEIAEVEGGEPAPADCFRAYLGLSEHAPEERARALDCVGLLDAALKDSEIWWDLPRLIAVLVNLSEEQPTAFSDLDISVTQGLEVLETTARQREDCAGIESLLQAL